MYDGNEEEMWRSATAAIKPVPVATAAPVVTTAAPVAAKPVTVVTPTDVKSKPPTVKKESAFAFPFFTVPMFASTTPQAAASPASALASPMQKVKLEPTAAADNYFSAADQTGTPKKRKVDMAVKKEQPAAAAAAGTLPDSKALIDQYKRTPVRNRAGVPSVEDTIRGNAGFLQSMNSVRRVHDVVKKLDPLNRETDTDEFAHSLIIDLLQELSLAVPYHAGSLNDAKVVDHISERLHAKGVISPEEWRPYIKDQSNADFDDATLWEAGTRPSMIKPGLMIRSPPCRNGEKCRAMVDEIDGFQDQNVARPARGVVLMIAMWKEEIIQHMATGWIPPDYKDRYCLLCLRMIVFHFVRTIRSSKIKLHRRVCAQPMSNTEGVGGYRKEFLEFPADEGWNGLAFPVAQYRLDGLVAIPPKEKTGLWHINQDKMRFYPADPKNPKAVFQS